MTITSILKSRQFLLQAASLGLGAATLPLLPRPAMAEGGGKHGSTSPSTPREGPDSSSHPHAETESEDTSEIETDSDSTDDNSPTKSIISPATSTLAAGASTTSRKRRRKCK